MKDRREVHDWPMQHYGTHRIGFVVAQIVMIWLLCISALDQYNIIHWNLKFALHSMRKTRSKGWKSLGGILLCLTDLEAAFTYFGHSSQLSSALTFMIYLALIVAYMG